MVLFSAPDVLQPGDRAQPSTEGVPAGELGLFRMLAAWLPEHSAFARDASSLLVSARAQGAKECPDRREVGLLLAGSDCRWPGAWRPGGEEEEPSPTLWGLRAPHTTTWRPWADGSLPASASPAVDRYESFSCSSDKGERGMLVILPGAQGTQGTMLVFTGIGLKSSQLW